jgi:hypothetical protein
MDLTVLVDDSPCLANAILHPVLWTDCRCPKSHCNAGKRARSALSVDSSHKTISRTRPSPEVSRRRYGCRHPRNACQRECHTCHALQMLYFSIHHSTVFATSNSFLASVTTCPRWLPLRTLSPGRKPSPHHVLQTHATGATRSLDLSSRQRCSIGS